MEMVELTEADEKDCEGCKVLGRWCVPLFFKWSMMNIVFSFPFTSDVSL